MQINDAYNVNTESLHVTALYSAQPIQPYMMIIMLLGEVSGSEFLSFQPEPSQLNPLTPF